MSYNLDFVERATMLRRRLITFNDTKEFNARVVFWVSLIGAWDRNIFMGESQYLSHLLCCTAAVRLWSTTTLSHPLQLCEFHDVSTTSIISRHMCRLQTHLCRAIIIHWRAVAFYDRAKVSRRTLLWPVGTYDPQSMPSVGIMCPACLSVGGFSSSSWSIQAFVLVGCVQASGLGTLTYCKVSRMALVCCLG